MCQISTEGLKAEVIIITNQEIQGNNSHKKSWKQNLDLRIEFACIIPLHVS